jgi:hypothetical protein
MCETSLVRRDGPVQINGTMTLRPRSTGWVLLAASLGCGSGSNGDAPIGTGINGGGQTGEEGIGCLPVETAQLAWSERSPLGFSADEMLGTLGSEHDARLTYEDGSSTTLSLRLGRGNAAVEYQQREWTNDDSGAEIGLVAVECPDVVSIPVTLTFSTGDAAFDEQWTFTLLAETKMRATAYIPLDLDDLGGSFMVTQIDTSQFEDVLAYLALTLGSESWSGTITGQATKTSGQGSDASASEQMFDIATF